MKKQISIQNKTILVISIIVSLVLIVFVVICDFSKNDVGLKQTDSNGINNVLWIGDSLTAGSYYGNSDASPIKANPPFFLSKISNWHVEYAAVPGCNPNYWYKHYVLSDEGCINYKRFDTIIIWLGSNDGLIDIFHDDPYADVDCYPNTETWYYCKIIENMISANPRLNIFLGNCYASRGDLKATNSTINSVAKRFDGNIVGVIDNNDGSLYMNDLQEVIHPFGNPVHFGLIGNAIVANHFYQSIKVLIERNGLRFE